MNKPTILITGASSYLAHSLVPIAARYGNVIGVARSASSVYEPAEPMVLDLADHNATKQLVKHTRPDVIIHAAAVNPGGDEQLMGVINHRASACLAGLALDYGCRFIMVSTDMVHRGNKAPYSDGAVPDPINTYGSSKTAGEQAVLKINPETLVIRTSLIYALEKIDRGTAGFRARIAQGDTLTLFDDVLRQPVLADDLSVAISEMALVHSEYAGTMNVVGKEVLSRASFGITMLEFWGVETSEQVQLRSGEGIDGLPIDLRCECQLAEKLGIDLPGVVEVLAASGKHHIV